MSAGYKPEDHDALQDAWADERRQSTQPPVDMVLYCPNCGTQHVDAPDEVDPHSTPEKDAAHWSNPPHRSHLCHSCGTIWRPADVPTNGVAEIKTAGKADTWPAHNEEVLAQIIQDMRSDVALLQEAYDHGQFADDFNFPQAKTVRDALKRVLDAVRTKKPA